MSVSLIPYNQLVVWGLWSGIFQLIWLFGNAAYSIRLLAIKEYGPIIHEFDPYFNYRATEYLYENGWQKFVTWFDYKSWYPLGRPVGTTIYPGMQVTAVFLKNWIIGDKMSLNDICCYMPAWFGVSSSVFTGLIAYECSLPQNTSGNFVTFLIDIYHGEIRKVDTSGNNSHLPAAINGVLAMGVMSIIPAHLMRSVGGGFDNESVAVTAMTFTFWLWCRSLRANDEKSYVWGIATGLAYFYMVAAWGGYVFVLNLIGVHAAFLVLIGRFSSKVYRSYSLFYVIGTFLATRVPVVGLTPFKSLEQLGPAVVFMGFQLLQYCEIVRKRKKLSRPQAWTLRIKMGALALAVGVVLFYCFVPTGYFGPISSRVRGLFVKHTKTGNPLVDSVAEHQPASADAYFKFAHNTVYSAPIGLALVLFFLGDTPSFLIVYAVAAYFFSSKMVRLVLLLSPIASALTGIAAGTVVKVLVSSIFSLDRILVDAQNKPSKSYKETKPSEGKAEKIKNETKPASMSSLSAFNNIYSLLSNSKVMIIVKVVTSCLLLKRVAEYGKEYKSYCEDLSSQLSHPTIITKGTTQSGEEVLVDDYRQAYTWIKENTPEDARILAWWDYGYQISAIANRTTIADGNTWNHEHIALLGRVLTSPEKEGHRIARHLADYILVWAGGGGDDLAKSPHLARIANSVYRDMCPGDPTCSSFASHGHSNGGYSSMLKNSLLYKLHSHKDPSNPNAPIADPNRFKEVYKSKYNKVRIFKILSVSKESKAWVADPANRICDSPGSWFCRGQYPPALNKVLVQKEDFAQLEDFNAGKKDDDYQKLYFEHLSGSSKHKKSKEKGASKKRIQSDSKPENSNSRTWVDTQETSHLWQLIKNDDFDQLEGFLKDNQGAAFVRSSDGRGPMWWAYEYRRPNIVKLLTTYGVSKTEKDEHGKTPKEYRNH